MTPFDEFLHAVLTEGGSEAQRDGSATVEAQHVLLAIASQEGTATQRVLDAEIGTVPRALALAGVDRAELRSQVGQLLEEA